MVQSEKMNYEVVFSDDGAERVAAASSLEAITEARKKRAMNGKRASLPVIECRTIHRL